MKVSLVLMTWKRIPDLKETLKELSVQTHKDFEVYLSNGNLEQAAQVDKYVNQYKDKLNIRVSHDGNEHRSFRRLLAARKLAQEGTEIIMFLDDDVQIPPTYIAKCLSQYTPKSYYSGFAWTFYNQGKNYYKFRTRRWDNKHKIHYCGTGMSMLDATIFLDDRLIDDAPKGALTIEDLWLSYFVDHVLGWELRFMQIPDVILEGSDSVALFEEILKQPYTKEHFLRDLVSMGWKI
jgi:glycosyltransferase involved in cell wall biosynthesis